MTNLENYSLWLEDRGITLPVYRQDKLQAKDPFEELSNNKFELQYAGSLRPNCLFLLDARGLDEWQNAIGYMLRIAAALGLSVNQVGVMGLLTSEINWAIEVKSAFLAVIAEFIPKSLQQIIAVGSASHDVMGLALPFEQATISPQVISLATKEISYLAIWHYREMMKDSALKKASWVAMQQLKNQ